MGDRLASLLHVVGGATRGFMIWNTLLALVPLGLALVLFRSSRSSGPSPQAGSTARSLWWIGAAAWLLFLPNAAYVLTDVAHLVDDVQRAESDLVVYGGLLPVYGVFFATGFASYVLSLRLLGRFVSDHVAGTRWVWVELGLHAVCAVGVYLGRFVRLNSWDVLTDPDGVAASFDHLTRRWPVFVIGVTFVILVLGALAARAVIDAAVDAVRRAFGPGRSGIAGSAA